MDLYKIILAKYAGPIEDSKRTVANIKTYQFHADSTEEAVRYAFDVEDLSVYEWSVVSCDIVIDFDDPKPYVVSLIGTCWNKGETKKITVSARGVMHAIELVFEKWTPSIWDVVSVAEADAEVTPKTKPKYVWLNIETGEFGNTWDEDDLVIDRIAEVIETATDPRWKLLQYDCLTDENFELNSLMKIK